MINLCTDAMAFTGTAVGQCTCTDHFFFSFFFNCFLIVGLYVDKL
jgi:hypothetical protein